MAANEKTGKKAGTSASKVLRTSKNTDAKRAAASALTQRPDRKKPAAKKKK